LNAGLLASDRHDLEFAVRAHRVFVLLPKISPVYEHVEARWKGVRHVGVLESVQGDRPRVLLAAEDKLGLLFASGLMPPDRHRDREQNGHNGQRNQQGSHCVSLLPPRCCLTM